MSTDVLVMGYGAAGGNAAIGAADAGAEVLLLEKAPFIGGNSACCLGAINVPKNKADAEKYYRRVLYGTVNEEMVKHCADEMLNVIPYIKSLGIEVNNPVEGKPDYPAFLPGATFHKYRFNPTGFGGIEALKKAVNSRPKIKVMLETPVTNIVQDPETKEVIGVKARSKGKDIFIKTKRGVVMACGGYEYNKEMMRNFNIPGVEDYIVGWGTPYNTGDGIRMAMGAGAYMWHFPCVEWTGYTPLAPARELGFAAGQFYGSRKGSIMVNRYGERFVREDRNTVHTKETLETFLFNEEKGTYPNIPFYLICDEEFINTNEIVHNKETLVKRLGGPCGYTMAFDRYIWSKDNSAEIKKGWVIKADTIKELANKINIPADVLEKTIETYNRDAATGKDSQFGRAERTLRPLKGPFYAVESGVLYVNTQGGPERNPKGEVLDFDKKPVPRLYGAGEFGAPYGFLYQGGNNFPNAWISGNNAGKNAAANKPHKY